jgi:hypothetical protein
MMPEEHSDKMVDRLVDNKAMTLIARAAMFLSAPMLIWVLGYVSGMARDIADVTTRVTVLEVRYETIVSALDRQDMSLGTLNNRTITILNELRGLPQDQP